MPYQTLRFIHAARTLVDCPLRDIGSIRPELRGLVRDATTLAFRKLITACVDHEIDFLLLTGDSLKQSDFSVRARVELRDGFDLLNDAGIQVFVVPGAHDPAPVWDDFPDWPNNVTVFKTETDDPVAVLRDGAVIASIRAQAWRRPWFSGDDGTPSADRVQRRSVEADENDDPDFDVADQSAATESIQPARSDSHRETRRVQSASELRPNHFAIAIVRDGIDEVNDDPQADYLAVVGGRERNTVRGNDWLQHFPGGTQGLSPEETDLHGCSIVDLDSDGVIRCRFLMMAPVRWENLDVEATDETTLEQFRQRMKRVFQTLCGLESTVVSESLVEKISPDEHGSVATELGNAADDGDSEKRPFDPPSQEESTSHSQREQATTFDCQAEALFVRWTVRGHGAMFESLLHESRQAELVEWLEAELDWPTELRSLHRFRLLAANAVVRTTEVADSDDDEQLDVPTEFNWRVDQSQSVGAEAWSDLGDESSVERERLTQVQSVVRNVDATVVFSQARRRGWSWFGRKTV